MASQSIIIAIDEGNVQRDPTAAPVSPLDRLPQAAPPPMPESPLAAPQQPLLIDPSDIEPAPAQRYVARRERSRRKQVKLAVMLLVAVVLLGLVLWWVLQRHPTTGVSAGSPFPTELTSARKITFALRATREVLS